MVLCDGGADRAAGPGVGRGADRAVGLSAVARRSRGRRHQRRCGAHCGARRAGRRVIPGEVLASPRREDPGEIRAVRPAVHPAFLLAFLPAAHLAAHPAFPPAAHLAAHLAAGRVDCLVCCRCGHRRVGCLVGPGSRAALANRENQGGARGSRGDGRRYPHGCPGRQDGRSVDPLARGGSRGTRAARAPAPQHQRVARFWARGVTQRAVRPWALSWARRGALAALGHPHVRSDSP